jgi:hypothetical protein
MKISNNKMTTRLTLLLAVVFSWLFVGSLIIFHQEHVLGKHSDAISNHFIVPKSKDKVGLSLKQLPVSQKLNLLCGDLSVEQDPGLTFFQGMMTKLIVSPLGLFSDHPPRMTLGLRAPPAS